MTTTIKQAFDAIFDEHGMPIPQRTALAEQLTEVYGILRRVDAKEHTIEEVTLLSNISKTLNRIMNKEILR